MINGELNGDSTPADIIRDLAIAEEAKKKQFAAIVRFVRRCEAMGPAKDMMTQIRRDYRLCKLLIDYEAESEIIGAMELVRDRFRLKYLVAM